MALTEPSLNPPRENGVELRPRLRQTGQMCSLYATAVSLGAWLWWLATAAFTTLGHEQAVPRSPWWALACLPLGFALWMNLRVSISDARLRMAGVAAAIALVMGLWSLLESVVVSPGDLSIARSGAATGSAAQSTFPPAWLNLAVASICSVLILGLIWRPRGWLAAGAGLAGTAFAFGYLGLTAVMLYQASTTRWDMSRPEGFLGTTAVLGIAVALVASSGIRHLPLKAVWQESNQAHLLRVFVPTTVALVLAAELLGDLLGECFSLNSEVMRPVRVLLPVGIVFAVGALLAQRVGRRLDAVESSLVVARDELEQRVAERTAALQRANKELQDEICSRVLAEAAQRESLANFAALGDLVPAAVLIQRDGRCIYANQVAADTVDYSREELIGRELQELVHPDFRALIVDRTLRRQAGETLPDRYEAALLRRTGEVRWMDSSARRILLRNEPAVMICALDVTERKQAEARLAASEERFRQVVENIREVFWMTDPAKPGFLYISKAFETIWGRTRENAYSLPAAWLENVHPEDRQRVQEAVAKLQTTGRYEQIYRIVRPDGLVRWIQDRAFPIHDERGQIYRIAGIAEDITAWKSTEETLRGSEERFRSLFEAAPIGIALLRAEGQYLRINRAYCELLGYSEVELLRLGTDRVTHPEDLARGRKYHRQLLSGERDQYAHEERFITKENQTIHVLSANSAVRDGAGNLRYVVSMLLDLSERKRLQTEVLEISSLERRRIGHDLHDGLGQYLSGIAFKAKCLEETLHADAPSAEPDATELVRLLNNAVSQARTLARGLDPVEAEVGGLVPALHKLAAESSELFSLDCSFECNMAELPLDTGVALHLFRIAQEAITNAARHGDAARIVVQLSQGVDDVRLRIEDNGCGFAVDQSPPDVGLGLRTMQYRADTIGASLQIWSKPDEGTEIECVLPLRSKNASAKP